MQNYDEKEGIYQENKVGQSEEKKIGQIERHIGICHKEGSILFDLLDTLENRLSPVIRPLLEGKLVNENRKEPVDLTPLASEIKGVGEKFTVAREKIRSILDRLEI